MHHLCHSAHFELAATAMSQAEINLRISIAKEHARRAREAVERKAIGLKVIRDNLAIHIVIAAVVFLTCTVFAPAFGG